MSINLIRNVLACRKRYCPRCCVQMERVKIRSNSNSIAGSKSFLQCPRCKSILMRK